MAPQTSGTVYYSLLLKVNSMAGATSVNGGYIAGFANSTTSGGTLWTKRVDNTNFNIGIEVKSATGASTTYSATSFQTGQTYLIIVYYTFNSGASNDIVNLWINPVINGMAPTPTLTDSHTATDLTTIGRFLIRQDSNSETPNVEIDELRIGTSWTSVTPAGPLSVKQNVISGLNIYPNPVTNGTFYVDTDANATKSITIFDIFGKEVTNTTITGNTVNVNNLVNGVYIVKVTEEGKTATKKLIIK